MAIVYEHIRNDTNEVFYVGIGVDKGRAFIKKGRTKFWKNIVNKVGYSVNIIHKDIEHKEAKKIEKYLIKKYGRKDLGLGNLVNMTDGGDGTLGLIVSEERRQKFIEINKGKTHFLGKTHSEEIRQKLSERNKGNTNMLGKTQSEEARQKMSKAHKGKPKSEEHIKKVSEANKGKPKSEEHKQRIGEGARRRKGVKGYYFSKAKKKYVSNITVRGKRIHLGIFDTPEEASQAYQKARLVYFV
jgi:predicted phage tail protein